MEPLTIKQDDQAVMELGQADPTMGKLIHTIGDIQATMRPELFKSLVRAIIGQQISVQAASAIFKRLDALLDEHITAETISSASDESLRAIGLSGRKVVYLRDLAEKILSSDLRLDQLHERDNDDAIKQLTGIKGIGKWTAEMFLIFSLRRMNVLAIDDIGIQRGAKWLYGVDKSERRNILVEKETVWRPHLTIASFYLWEVVHLDFEKTFASIDDM
ncbi:DNA-3-methyladenine glycosylase [Lentibacillus halophilus]|uniref:DNA-3-methyladenine glycosylase II n=1 Tax=Lentibacillus halophilus TaxID=295065 RepID=A0ABN0ZAC6_9BACI